jgi:hypothetical protein
MKTNALLDEIISLPMEERARMAEALLQSLNPQDDATMAACWPLQTVAGARSSVARFRRYPQSRFLSGSGNATLNEHRVSPRSS